MFTYQEVMALCCLQMCSHHCRPKDRSWWWVVFLSSCCSCTHFQSGLDLPQAAYKRQISQVLLCSPCSGSLFCVRQEHHWRLAVFWSKIHYLAKHWMDETHEGWPAKIHSHQWEGDFLEWICKADTLRCYQLTSTVRICKYLNTRGTMWHFKQLLFSESIWSVRGKIST